MQQVREFGNGSWCWWEPGWQWKVGLRETLDEVGLTTVKTDRSTATASLKAAASVLARRIKGTVAVEPLKDKHLNGFEAIIVTGEGKRNKREHVFTICLNGEAVELIDYSDGYGINPTNHGALEQYLTSFFMQEEAKMPTNPVSNVVQSIITDHLNGIRCRRAGIVYFVPPAGVEVLNTLSEKLSTPDSPFCLTTETASLFTNERSLELVARSFREQMQALFDEINEEIRQIEGRAYENGTQSRLSRILKAREKIDQYEDFLGVQLDDLRSVASSTEDIVNQAAVASLVA